MIVRARNVKAVLARVVVVLVVVLPLFLEPLVIWAQAHAVPAGCSGGLLL